MPYGTPAGLLALAAGANSPQGFGPQFAGTLGLLAQAQGDIAGGGNQHFENTMAIAKMEREIQAQEQQAAAQIERKAAIEAYAGSLPQDQRQLAALYPELVAKGQIAGMEPDDPTTLMQNVEAGGFAPGTPESQAMIQRVLTQPKTSINLNQGPKLESGFQWKVPGQSEFGVEPTPGGSRDMSNPKNWTGAMKTAAGFASMIDESESAISELEATGFNPATFGESTAAAVGRPAMGKAAKAYQDFQENWIRAVLRKQSGATITDEERSDYGRYFPQFGDGPEDMSRKAQIRQRLAEGIKIEAGPAYQAPVDLSTISTEELEEMARRMSGGNP